MKNRPKRSYAGLNAAERAAACEEFLRLTQEHYLTACGAARLIGLWPSFFSGKDSMLQRYLRGGSAALERGKGRAQPQNYGAGYAAVAQFRADVGTRLGQPRARQSTARGGCQGFLAGAVGGLGDKNALYPGAAPGERALNVEGLESNRVKG